MKDETLYQAHGAMTNWSVLVSYVSSNLPVQFGSSNEDVTLILRMISSGHLEVPSKLAGVINPVEVST